MGELRVAQWLLPLVAGAIGLRGGDKTEASLAVGGAATLLLAARSIIDSGRITPPGPAGGAAPMWAPARPDLDCWRHPVGAGRRRYPLPTSSSTAYFDAAAVLLGLAAAAFFLAVLYNNDVDQLAHWVGGRRGASQVDYAPEGSCRLWLTGGPWPTEGVVDAFLLFHFVAFFVVMLAYRDFYLCCILSPLLEVCEASFQHVLPNFKECVWQPWAGYPLLQRLRDLARVPYAALAPLAAVRSVRPPPSGRPGCGPGHAKLLRRRDSASAHGVHERAVFYEAHRRHPRDLSVVHAALDDTDPAGAQRDGGSGAAALPGGDAAARRAAGCAAHCAAGRAADRGVCCRCAPTPRTCH